MRSFTLQRGRGFFTVFLVVLFVLAAIGTFAYLQKTDRLAGFKVNMFSSIGTDEIAFEEDEEAIEKEPGLSIGITEGDNEQPDISMGVAEGDKREKLESQNSIHIFSFHRSYDKQAQSGDSITTLARNALKEYIEENWSDWGELTSEHKIFVEDYIQNHIGDRVLRVGETVEITEDLIVEGINRSQKLSESELEHLENFSELVWTSGFGTPRGL